MGQRSLDLAERISTFNNGVINFVESCSEEHWNKVCTEEWSVGVVARHIGAGHYTGAADMVKMIVAGQTMPEFTIDQIVEMANAHAREHAECSREEVLEILNTNGASLADYLKGLDDAELESSAHMELVGGNVSAQQLIEMVIFESGGEHLANMKKAVGV